MKFISGGLIAALTLTLGATAASAQDEPGIELPADRVTVVMTDLEPFVINNNGEADGFYAEIWNEVANQLRLDYDTIWVDSFAELLPAVGDGRADIAIAPLAPTSSREVAYDFTSAVISSGPQLGYHERDASSTSILRAFLDRRVLQILLAAMIGLVILSHFMWLLERNRHEIDGDFHSSYLRGIWDGIWWTTVTATTVGYGDKAPRSSAGRVLALFTMFLSLFLVGAFVSQVTEILRANRVEAPFSDIDSLGSTAVGAVEGTSFAVYLENQGANVATYASQVEVFEAAAAGDVDAVVGNPFALSEVGPNYGLAPTGDVLYEEFETFGVAQDSPWREPINRALADLQATGEIKDITNRWLGSS